MSGRRLNKSMDVLFPHPLKKSETCPNPDCDQTIIPTDIGHEHSLCRVCAEDVVDGRWNYCSERCRDIANAVQRMFIWDRIREQVLDRDGYRCQNCGVSKEMASRAHWTINDQIKKEVPHPGGEDGDGDWDCWREQRRRMREQYGLPLHEEFQVDHIQPISKGGHRFDESNLQTLCKACHHEKTAEENTLDVQPRPEIGLEAYLGDGGFTSVAEVGSEAGDDE